MDTGTGSAGSPSTLHEKHMHTMASVSPIPSTKLVTILTGIVRLNHDGWHL